MRLFVDHLTHVDFSYLCPERGLVGETWLASVELEGTTDEQGMICDFGRVKKHLRHWLDEQVDHKLVIPRQHHALQVNTQEDRIDLHWAFGEQQFLSSRSPLQAVALTDTPLITPEHLAHWCKQQLLHDFGSGVSQLRLTFTAEATTGPYYHYSHGLKKHLGNCQRIAHGHRSHIQVWRNQQLCLPSMQRIAHQWQDIYLGTAADLTPSPDQNHYAFSYRAQQGDYQLSLPAACCYLMDCDTTVENISAHLAQKLHVETPLDAIQVKAFEGINKGAICEIKPLG